MAQVIPIGRGTTLSWDDAETPTGTFTKIGCFQSLTPANDESESVFVECLDSPGQTLIGSDTASEASGDLTWICGDTDTHVFLRDAKANGTKYIWRFDNPDFIEYEQWEGRVRALNPNAIGGKGEPVTINVIIVRDGPKQWIPKT